MKISLASKVLQDRPAEEVIDLAASLGYDGVEWFCLPQHLPADAAPDRVAALGRRTRDAGLATVCLSTYTGGFADLDDAACEEQLDRFARYVDFAVELGCPLLRLWPDDMGKVLREPVTDALIDRVAGYFRRATDRAASSGVRVATVASLVSGWRSGSGFRKIWWRTCWRTSAHCRKHVSEYGTP